MMKFAMNGIWTTQRSHRHLFHGTLEARLQKSYHRKQVWLASVWLARESTDINHLANHPTQTDSTIRMRFEQWKSRRA